MVFRLFANLFRCLRGSSSTSCLPPRPPLSAWFHIDLHRPDCGDAVAIEAEESKDAVIETFKFAFPELANISSHTVNDIKLTVPQSLDLAGVTEKLRRAPFFDWEQLGETVVRDEFNAHAIRCKRTLFDAWLTKAEVLRRRVTRNQVETVERASQWIESFLSGPDSSVFSHIRSSVDMSTVWERFVCCVDEALGGRSVGEPPSPGKEVPSLAHPLFFTLGVFDVQDDKELKLKIYSVRLAGWADYRAEYGLLRSGIRGELKCVDYKVPSFS